MCARAVSASTPNDAATAVAAPARYSHSGTGSSNVPPMACAATVSGINAPAARISAVDAASLRLMDREDADVDPLRIGVGVQLDRELPDAG